MQTFREAEDQDGPKGTSAGRLFGRSRVGAKTICSGYFTNSTSVVSVYGFEPYFRSFVGNCGERPPHDPILRVRDPSPEWKDGKSPRSGIVFGPPGKASPYPVSADALKPGMRRSRREPGAGRHQSRPSPYGDRSLDIRSSRCYTPSTWDLSYGHVYLLDSHKCIEDFGALRPNLMNWSGWTGNRCRRNHGRFGIVPICRRRGRKQATAPMEDRVRREMKWSGKFYTCLSLPGRPCSYWRRAVDM